METNRGPGEGNGEAHTEGKKRVMFKERQTNCQNKEIVMIFFYFGSVYMICMQKKLFNKSLSIKYDNFGTNIVVCRHKTLLFN